MSKDSDDILFFVKFGQRKWIERLMQGKIYFSNSARFRQIEKEVGRGQGDAYEAMVRFCLLDSTILNTDIDNTKEVPVFCISAFREKDCSIQEVDGNRKAYVNSDVQKKVKKDFKGANTAAVFLEPSKLITSITNIAPSVHGEIHYFDLNLEHQDYAFFEYLVQESGTISKNNPMIMSTQFKELDGTLHPKQYITKRNAYRILFCKDLFFNTENEYRFALINKCIKEPQEFVIRYGNQKKALLTLDDLFMNGLKI